MAFLLCVSAFTPLAAQNTDLATRYDQQAIYLSLNFWRGPTYVKNGQSHPVGIYFRRLVPEFAQAPQAQPLLAKARKKMRTASAISLVGLGGMVTGLVVSENAKKGGRIDDREKYDLGQTIFWGSAVVSLVVTMPIRLSAGKKLQEAVWLRNREVLTAQ